MEKIATLKFTHYGPWIEDSLVDAEDTWYCPVKILPILLWQESLDGNITCTLTNLYVWALSSLLKKCALLCGDHSFVGAKASNGAKLSLFPTSFWMERLLESW